MPEAKSEYRALWRKRGGRDWSFTWYRGVVIGAPENGIVEVAVESRGIVRIKVRRLACHQCCGHGLVQQGKPGTENPVEIEVVPCAECAHMPRPGLRWTHPKDDFGESHDTDPSGLWVERYKARIEKINERIRRDWLRKQNTQGHEPLRRDNEGEKQ
jgi:hypothetical protein